MLLKQYLYYWFIEHCHSTEIIAELVFWMYISLQKQQFYMNNIIHTLQLLYIFQTFDIQVASILRDQSWLSCVHTEVPHWDISQFLLPADLHPLALVLWQSAYHCYIQQITVSDSLPADALTNLISYFYHKIHKILLNHM